MNVMEQTTMYAIQSINEKLPDLELRDLFAMHALSGLMVHSDDELLPQLFDYDAIANCAYKAADAMLERRRVK